MTKTKILLNEKYGWIAITALICIPFLVLALILSEFDREIIAFTGIDQNEYAMTIGIMLGVIVILSTSASIMATIVAIKHRDFLTDWSYFIVIVWAIPVFSIFFLLAIPKLASMITSRLTKKIVIAMSVIFFILIAFIPMIRE